MYAAQGVSTTGRYPLYLDMALELAAKLEKRGDLDSLVLALELRSYEETFLDWQRQTERPSTYAKTVGDFMTLARKAQEHLTRATP